MANENNGPAPTGGGGVPTDSGQPARKETSIGERVSYTLYFAGQNLVYALISGYLLVFYVSYLGINPALVATVFLVVRIWDAVNDPLIGIALDRLKLGRHRYKSWLTVTAFLMPIMTFALFLVPPTASNVLKIVLMIVTYVIWDALYTASEVPAFAVSTSMTVGEKERTILLTLTQIGSVGGTALGMGVAFAFLGDGVDKINWILFAGAPAILAVVIMVPQIFAVRERHHTEPERSVTIPRMIREVLRNDQHFKIMAMFVSQAFLNAATVFGTYVAEGIYGDARLASLTGVFTLVGILLLGAFTPAIVSRYGKKRYLEISMIVSLVLSVPIFFIPTTQPIVAITFVGLRTMALVVTSLLRPMFTADCIEYGQYKTGVRAESVAFSIQTFFNKAGDAIGTSLGGFVLAIAAFNENLSLAEQSDSTMTFLHMAFIILPMSMGLVMWLGPKFFYRLDEKKVKEFIASNADTTG